MLPTTWICRNCLRRIARPLLQRQLRHQSSSKPNIIRSSASPKVELAATSESIPPALLTRARIIALEHNSLAEKLADGFDAKVAKKLGQHGSIVNALESWDKANEVGEVSLCVEDGC